MVVSELIPLCQGMNLGRAPQKIGTMGISMGGYGAILLAEKYPDLIRAVAAISPAIWTSYDQAQAVNPRRLRVGGGLRRRTTPSPTPRRSPTRPSGWRRATTTRSTPACLALAQQLPKTSTVVLSQGCHTGPFFNAQEPPSLQFLGRHLAH